MNAEKLLKDAEAEVESSAKYLEKKREALRRAWLLKSAGGTAAEVRAVLMASGFVFISLRGFR